MEKNSFELPVLTDDGLLTPEIKPHSLEKYRAISYYLKIFTTSMKSKWNHLIYIDLFSGSGRSKIEGQDLIVPGSPLLALDLEDRFDKYVFCEEDQWKCDVLEKRVSAICDSKNFKIIQGDVNQNVQSILREMPLFSKSNTGLTFCLVDPYSLSNIRFETIKLLAEKLRVDFLVLIPSNMDARRNQDAYIDPDETTVDNFLGDKNWRDVWEIKRKTMKFGVFVLEYFCEKMKELGYVYKGMDDTMPVYLKEKNFALYHLMLFSKHPLGYRFWNDAKKGVNPQIGFDF